MLCGVCVTKSLRNSSQLLLIMTTVCVVALHASDIVLSFTLSTHSVRVGVKL